MWQGDANNAIMSLHIMWRFTIVNGAIALITIATVTFYVFRQQHPALTNRPLSSASGFSQDRSDHVRERELHTTDRIRLDALGLVAPAQIHEVLARGTSEDIAALARKFDTLPNNGQTMAARAMFFQIWAELDGKAALQGAFRIDDLGIKRTAAETVLKSISPAAAPSVAVFLREHPDKDLMRYCKNVFLDTVIEKWAFVDPPAAAKFLDDLGDTKNTLPYSAGGKIAYAWGTTDPYAALQWIDTHQNKDGVDRASAYNDVIIGWINKDIDAAAAYVLAHLERSGSQEALTSVAYGFIIKQPEKGMAWIEQLPNGETKLNVQKNVAAYWALEDPPATARWLETLPTDEQFELVGDVLRSWADNDWRSALAWLSTASENVRDRGLAAVTRSYVTDIPPLECLELAISISDENLRDETLREIVSRWAQGQPEAATAWVNNSALPAKRKQALLQRIP